MHSAPQMTFIHYAPPLLEWCLYIPQLLTVLCALLIRTRIKRLLCARDVEAEVGSGPFSVEAEAQKFHRFRIGGKKEIGSAILRRRANRGSVHIKK